jgi:hypothetical protein
MIFMHLGGGADRGHGMCAVRCSGAFVYQPGAGVTATEPGTALSIDPNDPRRLPDGSRYVDRLALALVAQHVGSRP